MWTWELGHKFEVESIAFPCSCPEATAKTGMISDGNLGDFMLKQMKKVLHSHPGHVGQLALCHVPWLLLV